MNDYSMYALLGSGMVAAGMATWIYGVRRRRLMAGLMRSARQMIPCLPLLALIATVSTTWMLSGVVPFLVETGIGVLNPTFYLALTCLSCAIVSSLTGSSWTTIATVGVAFLGIGSVFGYDTAWTAGAIISGAYFGDKFSPLSDTTVIASATTGVEIFTLIRHMVVTTIPAFVVALIIFALLGIGHDGLTDGESTEMVAALGRTFNLTPWVLLIPGITFLLIVLRVPTLITLALSTVAGVVGIVVLQPGICAQLGIDGVWNGIVSVADVLFEGASPTSGYESVDALASTGGIVGMIPTMLLIMGAMVFGGAMIGSGFLERLTRSMAERLNRRHSIVGTTVATGVTLNALTADQYVSIIIGGSIFKNVYKRAGLEPRLLGRTIQDSVPVTSVLIPWNSCGVTQSAVLGVATVAYLPFCLFNILSPISSIVVATINYHLQARRERRAGEDMANRATA